MAKALALASALLLLGVGTASPAGPESRSVRAAAVAAGNQVSCAVTRAGRAECWGHNQGGQLGTGTTKNHTKPVAVSGLASGIEGIAAGGFQTCALSSGGGVECWGGRGRQVVPKPVPAVPSGANVTLTWPPPGKV